MKPIRFLLSVLLPVHILPFTHNQIRISPLRLVELIKSRPSRYTKFKVSIASQKSPDVIDSGEYISTATATTTEESGAPPNPLAIESNLLEPLQQEVLDAPDLKKILRFALPAIGVWLCNPLLSLIDTSCVGLLSGTAQQAALNPATAVTDYGALLAAFMYTATTNLVAGAKESDIEPGKQRTKETMINAIKISGYVGAVLGIFFILFTKPLLRLIIGNDGIDAQVFDAATRYVRIRALGMPAGVIIGSAQSACLGLQDIRSPFYVLLAAALVNFTGDMLFVGSKYPFLSGAAGAAWATTLSQYFAVLFFMKWLTQPSNSNNKTSTDKSTTFLNGSSKIEPTARGFLAGKLHLSDFFKLPSFLALQSFWPFFLPVTMTSIGRVSAYVAMSHVVSSSLGTLSMAANQIILSLFYCLTPVADSLNLTAQSFIPPLFEKKNSISRAVALRKALNSFLYAAFIFGAALSCSVCVIPLFSNLFTTDAMVMSQVITIIPWLFGVFLVHGIICAGEGFLLGCKDLNFLSRMYALYFIAMPYFMLRVKWASSLGQTVNLSSVWRVFLGYQFFRSTAWFCRLQILQRRTEREFKTAI